LRNHPHSALRRLAPLLALAVLLRAAWIAWALSAGIAPASDAGWYYERAIGIASGGGYAIGGVPTAYWPVGYPAFLGGLFLLTGPSQLAAMIANILLQCGTMALTYAVARSLFDSERVAWTSALILAISPNQIAYSSLLMSEPLALMLMMGGTALLLRARGRLRPIVAAGIVLGLGTLVKPQMIAIPALWCLAGWIGSRRKMPTTGALRETALCYLLLLAVAIPWAIRNHRVFGEGFVLSTNDGMNLFIGNNPAANGTYMVNDSLERSIYGATDPGSLNEYERTRAARRYALDYIASHPVATIALMPAKLWYLYRADAEGFSWNMRSLPDDTGPAITLLGRMKIVAQGFYLLLAIPFLGWLATEGRWSRNRATSPYRAMGLWTIAYFTLIPLVYFGDGRFHAPAIPWIAIYAGAFIDAMIERRRPAATSRGSLPRINSA
jgi:4-amino-4-deoxy-L-arabinose transferase-like glycosyltransferase